MVVAGLAEVRVVGVAEQAAAATATAGAVVDRVAAGTAMAGVVVPEVVPRNVWRWDWRRREWRTRRRR